MKGTVIVPSGSGGVPRRRAIGSRIGSPLCRYPLYQGEDERRIDVTASRCASRAPDVSFTGRDRPEAATAGCCASMRAIADPCNHADVTRVVGASFALVRGRSGDGERHATPSRTRSRPRHFDLTHFTHARFQRKPSVTRAAAERPPSDPPRGGDTRHRRGHFARVDGYPAGARLRAHRRHAGRHRALHGVPAARCIRVLRRVAPSRGRRRLRDRDDFREPAVVDGAGRQRRLCGAGRHGRVADRRDAAARADLQARLSRRFPVAHGAGRFSRRRRRAGVDRDARRHVRPRRAVPGVAQPRATRLRRHAPGSHAPADARARGARRRRDSRVQSGSCRACRCR